MLVLLDDVLLELDVLDVVLDVVELVEVVLVANCVTNRFQAAV